MPDQLLAPVPFEPFAVMETPGTTANGAVFVAAGISIAQSINAASDIYVIAIPDEVEFTHDMFMRLQGMVEKAPNVPFEEDDSL